MRRQILDFAVVADKKMYSIMRCKICQQETEVFDHAKILSAYSVTYFRCKKCGFIQTEEPYWLDEAYSSAIADLDIGLVTRNLYLSNAVGAILKLCFSDAKNFLDYGGVWTFCSDDAR